MKKCECFCYLGEFYGLANTSFYKNECRWKQFVKRKTFTCFIQKSCRTRIFYRGRISSNTTSTTTTATDFTTTSNTTKTLSKIEIEKIDFKHLKSINMKLCVCMCYMGKAFGLSYTSFNRKQCFRSKGSKFLSWEFFFCFIEKSCQTENFIFFRGKLSSNSTSSASNTTTPKVFTTSKPKIEIIDYKYLDSINVVQCGCSCKYGEFHKLANTSFYINQCFDLWI